MALAERLGSPKKFLGSLPGLGKEYGVESPSRAWQIKNTSYKVKRGSQSGQGSPPGLARNLETKKRIGERTLAERLGSPKKVFGKFARAGKRVESPSRVWQIGQNHMNISYKVGTGVWQGVRQAWKGILKRKKESGKGLWPNGLEV